MTKWEFLVNFYKYAEENYTGADKEEFLQKILNQMKEEIKKASE